MTRCVLLTGFTPFAGARTNPSWDLVKALPNEIAGATVKKVRVPTEFGRSVEKVVSAIDRFKPALVLCFGQAGDRASISVERIAINVNDAAIADNAGMQPIDETVRRDGPAAYFCTVPIKAMVAAMHKKGIPADISNSAGTFVCNHLIYGVMHHIAIRRCETRAGFIHLPYLESQTIGTNLPSMSLAAMSTGAMAAIAAALRQTSDLRLAGGSLS